MKKTLALFFVLPIFAMGCQSTTVQKTADEQQAPSVTDETTAQLEVKHYSEEGGLSFDYPGDLEIFRVTQGEGSWSEELTFLEKGEDGIYYYAGPVLSLASWGGDLSAEEQYKKDLKDAGDAAQPVDLSVGEAFEVSGISDFGGTYTSLEFLFPNSDYDPSVDYGAPYFYGSINRPFVAPETRYQEILDLFEQTVSFN